MNKKINKKYLLIAIVLIIIIIIFGSKNYVSKKEVDFDVLFLKNAIIKGGESSSNIKIKSNLDEKEHFTVRVSGSEFLEDLVFFENEFDLDPDSEKNLVVNFKSYLDPGVYIGKLTFYYGEEEESIPLILEIQSEDVLFDSNVNLFPRGDNFVLGQKINAQIGLYDLSSIGRSDVKLKYQIKDFEDHTIVSESENLIIDGKLDYSKSFDLPEDLNLGNYALITIVEYENSVGTSSVFFKVQDKKTSSSLNNNSLILWIIVLFVLFFVCFIGLFIYFLMSRDRLLRDLKNQYKGEIRRQRELINLQSRGNITKLKTVSERKVYNIDVERIRKKRIEGVKNIYAKRIKKFKELKRKGNKSELKRQLSKWKSKGYDTRILENKFKVPKASDIRKKMREWKSKGYDTSILDKGSG